MPRWRCIVMQSAIVLCARIRSTSLRNYRLSTRGRSAAILFMFNSCSSGPDRSLTSLADHVAENQFRPFRSDPEFGGAPVDRGRLSITDKLSPAAWYEGVPTARCGWATITWRWPSRRHWLAPIYNLSLASTRGWWYTPCWAADDEDEDKDDKDEFGCCQW